MSNLKAKTPFVKLVIPAIVAIILSGYCVSNTLILITLGMGIALISLSYLLIWHHQYATRWIFSIGVYFVIYAAFSFSAYLSKEQSKYNFTHASTHYIGTIASIPQEKNKTFACEIIISHPRNKKIIAYIQKNEIAKSLKPGDEVVFYSKIDSIKNFGNPDDFNYARYMHNKGFAGTTYIPGNMWQVTGKINRSLSTQALLFRQKTINLYKSLNLSHEAFTFVTALTLGYKEDLSNELKRAFQASGTSHVLAVSGLHVGIIFAAIALLTTIFGKVSKLRVFQQVVIITSLWAYALLTGMSPSVTRATIMLTIALIGKATNRNLFTYNIISASAFLILLFNPLQLFDVGFQMSFAAVISIVAINPILVGIIKPNHKISKWITNLITISLSAQLGVLPITLYYFGTFPTYFFLANLIVVPAITIAIYTAAPTIVVTIFSDMGATLLKPIQQVFKWALESIIEITLRFVYLIESLPMSQLNNIHISLFQTIIAIITISTCIYYVKQRTPASLILTLCSLLIIVASFIHTNATNITNKVVISNSPDKADIYLYIDNKKTNLQTPKNGFIPHNHKKILLLSENKLDNIIAKKKLELDILILSNDKSFSISKIHNIFSFKILVIDSTIPNYIREKWHKECHSLGIDVHDISKDGAYLINL